MIDTLSRSCLSVLNLTVLSSAVDSILHIFHDLITTTFWVMEHPLLTFLTLHISSWGQDVRFYSNIELMELWDVTA
jgi:hypothetical protein